MRHLFASCLFACAGAASAVTAQPDVLVFDSDRLNGSGDAVANYELHTMKLDGSGTKRLTNNNTYDSWWGRPSPDGSRILFCRTPAGVHDTNYGEVSLWCMDSDGSDQVQLRAKGADGWTIQGHPEWSPDGHHICIIGTAGTPAVLQIFVIDTDGTNPRQVTTGSLNKLDCSWSRDGSQLLVVSQPAAGAASTQEVYRVPAAGGALTRLTTDTIEDYDPYYSPDGSRIAWLSLTNPNYAPGFSAWNIRVMNADGTNVGLITGDLHINSKPEWSPDGGTIYFHRFVYGGSKWHIYRTSSSGGQALELVSPGAQGNNTFPAFLHHAPVVTVTKPSSGTVSGTVTLTATVVSSVAITNVRFQVDGVDVATDTTAPYTYSWDADAAGLGGHTVKAIATDTYASSASATKTVTVGASGSGSGGSGGGGGGGCGVGGGVASLLLMTWFALGLRRFHTS